MAAGGLYVTGTGSLPHLHLPGFDRLPHGHTEEPRELKPWMPAVHGFVAGWGLDAFSAIIYTTLAPAMPSAALGWLPGLLFGLGTLIVQALAGAAFGLWAAKRLLPATAIRAIALITAARTLTWGGVAFFLFGVFSLLFPKAADVAIPTPLHIHNLDALGLPFLLVIFTVLGVGVTTFVGATKAFRRGALVADSAS
jgi:hypothetical protein